MGYIAGILILLIVVLFAIASVQIARDVKQTRLQDEVILKEVECWCKNFSPSQEVVLKTRLRVEDVSNELTKQTENAHFLWRMLRSVKQQGGGIGDVLVAFRQP